MIVIKGWVDHPDFSFRACEHIAAETAVMLIEAAKDGPVEGYIRRPGGTMFQYNRYTNGRIIVKQI